MEGFDTKSRRKKTLVLLQNNLLKNNFILGNSTMNYQREHSNLFTIGMFFFNE